VVQSLLTLAVVEPTIGCRQYADRLGDQGFSIAKSTVQKHLVAHALGKRSQRLARAAAITAATTGLLTDAARDEHLFGFCLATGGPGELVCLDSFYIGKLKGVGKVYDQPEGPMQSASRRGPQVRERCSSNMAWMLPGPPAQS
jgi:hypothetical protein